MTNKKLTFKDLFQVNIKYLEYLLAKSYLSHQYLKNIKLSGDQIEVEFRKILAGLLPQRYKVTQGYIVSAKSLEEEPVVSSQIDIIIVDTLVPHSIYILEDKGMEVVPLECVVGIFEIKRTIDPKIFNQALEHLFTIQKDLNIDKTDTQIFSPTGISGIGMLPANPIMGILSLTHKKLKDNSQYQDKYGLIIKKRQQNNTMPDLDIWASLGNAVMTTCSENDSKMLWTYVIREIGKEYPYLFKISPNKKDSQSYTLAISIGFILFYLSQITGRGGNIENYFFNHSIN